MIVDTFSIAGICFQAVADTSSRLYLETNYSLFRSDDQPFVRIFADYRGIPDLGLGPANLVYDSEIFWTLHQVGDRWAMAMTAPALGSKPCRVGLFSRDWRDGVMHFENPCREPCPDGTLPHPLSFPYFHLVMESVLGTGLGINLHACGIEHDGEGYLFTGHSGRGKTTMSRLWEGRGAVLADERIILREHKDGRIWIYGTPWHGLNPRVSPQGVPLRAIFLLEHAGKHRVEPVAMPAVEVLKRCFHPDWVPGGLEFTVDFAGKVAERVPCRRLHFHPDPSVVDFVLDTAGR